MEACTSHQLHLLESKLSAGEFTLLTFKVEGVVWSTGSEVKPITGDREVWGEGEDKGQDFTSAARWKPS